MPKFNEEPVTKEECVKGIVVLLAMAFIVTCVGMFLLG